MIDNALLVKPINVMYEVKDIKFFDRLQYKVVTYGVSKEFAADYNGRDITENEADDMTISRILYIMALNIYKEEVTNEKAL